MDKKHVFEQAGLGLAPFRCVGVKELHYGNASAGQDFGGSCEYCGHYIRNGFFIESADGKHFVVGSDCVEKTGDKGMKKEVDMFVYKAKQKKHAEDWKRVKEHYMDYAEQLNTIPHPYRSTDTMMDYITYSLLHGHFQSTEKRIISAFKKAERMAT